MPPAVPKILHEVSIEVHKRTQPNQTLFIQT